ncbi:hypothetical protein SAMN04487983_101426 [Streptomyces sp. yr375]|uniref:hypothetical protein n=1 Tax=Streptomyces sp. yr375 TaxID=1761906 RepID=UPI0008B5D645|nr:hypothetical protein [Streptomyces sp. yr375]SER29377.1 hypothetical protein SAMN04487983_101426 [Streptomyces sp. yr375]
MSRSRLVRPARPVRPAFVSAVVGVVVLLASVVSGCGDAGELQGAGSTPTAISPDKLWPDLTPAASPAFDIGEVDTEVVRGITVPGGDIRTVDPVAVVRAEIAANPADYNSGTYDETARRMADCGKGKGGVAGRRCPVLKAYYRDLTGDGHDDMTLGFRQLPGNLTAVRVYTVRKDRLVQIMGYEDAVSAVELAGRSVIIRAPSEVAGYEYRLQWTWDQQQRAMLLTNDEMLRIGGPNRKHSPRPSASPSASPSGSSASPSASRR